MTTLADSRSVVVQFSKETSCKIFLPFATEKKLPHSTNETHPRYCTEVAQIIARKKRLVLHAKGYFYVSYHLHIGQTAHANSWSFLQAHKKTICQGIIAHQAYRGAEAEYCARTGRFMGKIQARNNQGVYMVVFKTESKVHVTQRTAEYCEGILYARGSESMIDRAQLHCRSFPSPTGGWHGNGQGYTTGGNGGGWGSECQGGYGTGSFRDFGCGGFGN